MEELRDTESRDEREAIALEEDTSAAERDLTAGEDVSAAHEIADTEHDSPAEPDEATPITPPAPAPQPSAVAEDGASPAGDAAEQVACEEPSEPQELDEPGAPSEPQEPAEPDAPSDSSEGLVPAPTPEAVLAHMGDTQPSQPVAATLPLPEAHDLSVAGADSGSTGPIPPAPRLSDVGATFAAWARGRERAAQTWFSTHRLVSLALVLAALAAVFALTLFASRAAQVPPDDQVTQDAHEQLVAPAHASSSYTDDTPLALQALDIVSKHHSPTRDDACDVVLTCTFANDSMQTVAEGTLTYVRQGDEWLCIAATTANASHRATAGVSHDRALKHLDELLQAADTSSDGSESLGSLYRNATVEVEADNFDQETQTEALTLHLSKPGTFVSYDCRLAAHFRFTEASGAWELVEVRASDGAKDLGFSPLVGTWQGTFRSQQTEAGKCLAASEAGLTVVITSADVKSDGQVLLEGTVSGVAHLHAATADDVQQSEGDLTLSEVPFTGSLAEDSAHQSAGLVFVCTTQDQAGGQVTLTLEFGSASAPDAASATLESVHPFEDTILLIVPYQREAYYADTFTLVKAS